MFSMSKPQHRKKNKNKTPAHFSIQVFSIYSRVSLLLSFHLKLFLDPVGEVVLRAHREVCALSASDSMDCIYQFAPRSLLTGGGSASCTVAITQPSTLTSLASGTDKWTNKQVGEKLHDLRSPCLPQQSTNWKACVLRG